MTNTTTIADAYIDQNNKFLKLKDRAQKCIDCDNEINKTINKSNAIIKDVFKNFSSDRKKLGIFILKKYHYNSEDKDETPKILMSKDDIPKGKTHYYEELCMNKTGFSLLHTYGRNSVSILDNSNDRKIYYLSMITDKRIMDKLKETIDEDKFNLLNKILQDIKLLEYNNEYKKKQPLTFYKIKNEKESFKQEKNKTEYINLKFGNGYCRCSLKEDSRSSYYGTDYDLVRLDISSGLVLEQVRDEVLEFLNECYIDLLKKKEVMTEYLTKLEERLNKELIMLALMNK